MPDSVRIYGGSGGSHSGSGMSRGSSGSREHSRSRSQKARPAGNGLHDEKECKAKLLKLLAMRDYTRESMRAKLVGAGFSEEVVSKTIDYAIRTGFLNDKRYAENFIATKKEMGWGKGRIERALSEKGVQPSELESLIENQFDEDEELARARRCVRSHRTNAKNARESHYRYLLSKGYSPAIASKALHGFGNGCGDSSGYGDSGLPGFLDRRCF